MFHILKSYINSTDKSTDQIFGNHGDSSPGYMKLYMVEDVLLLSYNYIENDISPTDSCFPPPLSLQSLATWSTVVGVMLSSVKTALPFMNKHISEMELIVYLHTKSSQS